MMRLYVGICLYLCQAILLTGLRAQTLIAAEDSIRAAARQEIDTLCSNYFAGRGYLDEGHRKAAQYIAHRFEAIGLEPMGAPDFWQEFPLEINLVREAEVSLGSRSLEAGTDFIVSSLSGSGKGRHRIKDIGFGLGNPQKATGKVLMFQAGFPPEIANDSDARKTYQDLKRVDQRIDSLMAHNPAGFIVLQKKLTAGFTRRRLPVPVIEIQIDSIPRRVKSIDWEVLSQMKCLRSQNVVGMIPGTTVPDSFVVLTAHYDHLGRYAGALFPGANDNASGIAMLLSLAAHIKATPLPYSVLFIAFGGEETGLVGSRYFALRQPLIALDRIKFLLNLDLMGNGTEGLMAVGGKENPEAFEKLKLLNDSLGSVPIVRARTNAPNSDHYFFLRQGVPGFFVYTMGGPPHYHDVNDRPANLELSRFSEVKELLFHFLKSL